MSDDHKTLALRFIQQASSGAYPELQPVVGGMSGASVFRVVRGSDAPNFLKIATGDAAAGLRAEIKRTVWLARQDVRVPTILRVDDQYGYVAILSEAMSGVSVEFSPLPTPRLLEGLANGFAALHALPPDLCPFDETQAVRLARAAKAVAADEIDPNNFEPCNLGLTPEALLQHLIAERPNEDIVVVHGDATLSNIMIDEKGRLGFIDCGNSGRGDRYVDLAVVTADIADKLGAESTALFVDVCGLPKWDAAKARYYIDLYEFF